MSVVQCTLGMFGGSGGTEGFGWKIELMMDYFGNFYVPQVLQCPSRYPECPDSCQEPLLSSKDPTLRDGGQGGFLTALVRFLGNLGQGELNKSCSPHHDILRRPGEWQGSSLITINPVRTNK